MTSSSDVARSIADALPNTTLIDRGRGVLITTEDGSMFEARPMCVGGVVTRRATFPVPPGCGAQVPKMADPAARTDRILDALFGGRAPAPVPDGGGPRRSAQFDGPWAPVGVDERDYANGGLP